MRGPYRVCPAQVPDHLLNEELGLAIGVGTAPRGVGLIQRQVLGVPVHGGRAAEHQVLHPVGPHDLAVEGRVSGLCLTGKSHLLPHPRRVGLRRRASVTERETGWGGKERQVSKMVQLGSSLTLPRGPLLWPACRPTAWSPAGACAPPFLLPPGAGWSLLS